MMFKKATYALILLFCTSFISTSEYTYEFAIRLTPSSEFIVTTAIVTIKEGKVVKEELISMNQFVQDVSGMIKSKANPTSKDLFKIYGIFSCSQIKDTITWRFRDTGQYNIPNVKSNPKYKTDFIVQDFRTSCPVLAELWKVRYAYDIRKKAYNGKRLGKPEGWAADTYWPNLAQVNFLKMNYGTDLINEYVHGKLMFQFLKDVQDTSWINQYIALR